MSCRQRKRRYLAEEANRIEFLREAKQFLEFWTPQKHVEQDIAIKPEKSVSHYYPGGKNFENGRKLWLRPCVMDYDRFVFGDSMLRVFQKGKVKYPGMTITSFGGCDLSEGLILLIFGKIISAHHT